MKKLTIGIAAAAAAAAVSAGVGLSQVAQAIAPGRSVDVVATAAAAKVSTKAVLAAPAVKALTTTSSVTAKAVRSIRLTLPTTTAKVGANIIGTLSVVDTLGTVLTPVVNADVALQQQRGTVWVDLANGLTDDNGSMPVGLEARTNTTVRAIYHPATGKALTSASLKISATATVVWATRPDLTVSHSTRTPYTFRVTAADSVIAGHLEFASTSAPAKWTKGTSVKLDNYNLVAATVTFPKAGTYLVRGVSDASTANASGYTTPLRVTVS